MTNTATLDAVSQNMQQCWHCSHCKWTPTLKDQRFNKICPSMEWGNFHAYSGGGKVITAYGLHKNAIPYTNKMLEGVFACTMCGACDVGCKSNNGEMIEPLDVLYALRARIADDGRSLPAHVVMVESLRANGNPFGKSAAERTRWAEGLNLKDATREPVDVLLHIGDDNAYTPEYWPELQAIVRLLMQAGVSFGIVPQERATGEVAYDIGFQADARDQAIAMAAIIKTSQAKAMVTCSAGSYAAIRNIWPRLGVPMEGTPVTHITEFVESLFELGLLHASQGAPRKVTYHDSCKLGRLSEIYVETNSEWTTVLNNWVVREPPKPILFGTNGLYDAPRKLLSRIAGVSLEEMPRNREASWCCGGAGGAPQAYPAFADFAARERLEEAGSTGAATVVTASCACQRQLEQAATSANPPNNVKVSGLFVMLAEATAAPVPVHAQEIPRR